MDVVIRTPHGDADVRIGATRRTTRVADVVEVVTGRVAPPVVEVDGRAVPAATSLVEAGVLNGSVVDLGPPAAPAADAVVDLVQHAGWGTGERAALAPGTYRVGPGRRVNAPELHQAPVDAVAFELTVADDGSVTVRTDHDPHGDDPVRLDGVALGVDTPVAWWEGVIDVAGRVFALECHTDGPLSRPLPASASGTRSFNRPPLPPLPDPTVAPASATVADAPQADDRRAARAARARWPAADPARTTPSPAQHARRAASTLPASAVNAGRDAVPELWRHRVGRRGALRVGLGIGDITDDAGAVVAAVPVEADLAAEDGIALVGSTDFVRSAARAIIVGLTTAHGPSDLAVVVATHPDRVGVWEWTKWLPHARTLGTIDVVTSADAVAAAIVDGARPSRLTLVVADEPTWWRDRAAPLRPLLAGGTSTVRVLALVGDADEAPTVCTTLVTETVDGPGLASSGRSQVDHLVARRRIDGVVTYLLSSELATAAARGLAAHDDPDLPEPPVDPSHRRAPLIDVLRRLRPGHDGLDTGAGPEPTVADLVAGVASMAWERRAGGVGVPLGLDGDSIVTAVLDDEVGHLVLAGPEAPDVLRGALAALAVTVAPDALGMVLIGAPSTFGSCDGLPHVVGRVVHPDEHDAARTLRCLRAELRRRSSASAAPEPRLLVVLDEPSTRDAAGFADAVLQLLARVARLGVHAVIVTDRPSDAFEELLPPATTVRLDVASRLGELTTRPMTRSSLRRAVGPATGLDPLTARTVRTALPAEGPDVEAFVIGRELTTLERRLARGGLPDAAGPTQDLDAVVAAADAESRRRDRRPARRCIPDPLPDRIELASLLREHPGDAVPWALVDLPDEQRLAPRWWFPSAGTSANLLVTGARGGAAAWPLTSLALGIATRASADDVHLYVVAAGDAPLAPLAELPHVGAVVDVGDLDRLVRLLGHLAAEVDLRRERAAHDGPEHVLATSPGVALLVDDLGAIRARLRSRADLADAWDDIDLVLRAGAPLGVNVVATLRSGDEVPPGTELAFATRYVSATAAASPPGRAVELGEQPADVQFAEPPTALREAITELGAEPARSRPPTGTFAPRTRRDPTRRSGAE